MYIRAQAMRLRVLLIAELIVATAFSGVSARAGSLPVAATPKFSLAWGFAPYGLPGSTPILTLTDATPGASIYYAFDDSNPTTSSTLYTGPITLSASELISVIAVAPGYLESWPLSISAGLYTPTPIFSLPSGTYVFAPTLTITDAVAGASIYYTTDGSDPMNSPSSKLYTGPITVSASETITAIAVAPGWQTYGATMVPYTIDPLLSTSATTTALSSSAYGFSTLLGQSVTFTAEVTAASGNMSPFGPVQFYANGAPLGSPVMLNPTGRIGVATFTTGALPAGYLIVTAAYIPPGGAPFSGSASAPLTQPVYSSQHLTNNVWFNNSVMTLGSGFYHPYGVAVDASDNVFVADSGNGAVKEIVAASGYSAINTLGGSYSFPTGVAVDAAGNLFVTDSANSALYELSAAGGYSSTLNLSRGFNWPVGVAVDALDSLYIADTGNSAVKKMTRIPGAVGGDSYSDVMIVGSGFVSPWGITVDGSGNVFVSDVSNGSVKEILAGGGYSTVNNLGGGFFDNPYGLAVDANDDLFVSDIGFGALKEISEVDSFTTVSAPGPGLNLPIGVAVDTSGNIFVADTDNNAVKEISQVGGNFGSVAIGGSSASTISMVFFFDASTTLGSMAVLAQQGGAASFDFANAGTGSCRPNTTYAANGTCSVDVIFAPTQSGTRSGVVELLDGSGNVLAVGPVQGTGVANQL